jgi:TetR/AcrR family transcriptional repressor of mexJK operon
MAEKRTEVLRAARSILLRDGLGGTTLDRVAAEGRISKMTLYRHFPSKEALFEGLPQLMARNHVVMTQLYRPTA